MSVKQTSMLWVKPDGEIPPSGDPNQERYYGAAIGIKPEDLQYDPANTTDGIMHPRFQTASPHWQYNGTQWVNLNTTSYVQRNRRPQIDYSNFDDPDNPYISMQPQTQQLMRSTNNMRTSGSFVINGLAAFTTSVVDPYGDQATFYRYNSSSVVQGQEAYSVNQNIGSQFGAYMVQAGTLSVFTAKNINTDNDVCLGLRLRVIFPSDQIDHSYDIFATFDYTTERLRVIDGTDKFQCWGHVEKYPNGFYRLFINAGWNQDVTLKAQFHIFRARLGGDTNSGKQEFAVTPETFLKYAKLNSFYALRPHSANSRVLLSKPAFQVSGYFNSGGYHTATTASYLENTGVSIVSRLQTGFRISWPYTKGQQPAWFFDVYFGKDAGARSMTGDGSFWQSNSIREVSEQEYSGFAVDRVHGYNRVVHNSVVGFNSSTGNALPKGVQLKSGRNKILYQAGSIWVNGTKYTSDLTARKPPISWAWHDYTHQGNFYKEYKPETRHWFKEILMFDRVLTDQEAKQLFQEE